MGGKWGFVLSFFAFLIGAAYYFNMTGSTVLASQVLNLIYGTIAAAFVSVVVYSMVKRDYMATAGGYVRYVGQDGERIEMGIHPTLGPGEKVPTPERMGDTAAGILNALHERKKSSNSLPPPISYHDLLLPSESEK